VKISLKWRELGVKNRMSYCIPSVKGKGVVYRIQSLPSFNLSP
jgi:hypothetical protein